jgi:hypothetical protein
MVREFRWFLVGSREFESVRSLWRHSNFARDRVSGSPKSRTTLSLIASIAYAPGVSGELAQSGH